MPNTRDDRIRDVPREQHGQATLVKRFPLPRRQPWRPSRSSPVGNTPDARARETRHAATA